MLVVCCAATIGIADDESAAPPPSGPKYTLKYKFQPKETVRTKVLQRVVLDTTISGTTQTAETTSGSVKAVAHHADRSRRTDHVRALRGKRRHAAEAQRPRGAQVQQQNRYAAAAGLRSRRQIGRHSVDGDHHRSVGKSFEAGGKTIRRNDRAGKQPDGDSAAGATRCRGRKLERAGRYYDRLGRRRDEADQNAAALHAGKSSATAWRRFPWPRRC